MSIDHGDTDSGLAIVTGLRTPAGTAGGIAID